MQHYSYRHIWWDKTQPVKNGKRFASIYLMVGYNQMTLSDFKAMAKELRKSFPFMKESDIHCGVITKSIFYERHAVVVWRGMLDYKDYPEWTCGDIKNMSYFASC